MAKRMTATEKWSDGWFSDLPPIQKLFWLFLLDNCNHAGLWEYNSRILKFNLGEDFEFKKELFNTKIIEYRPFNFFIPNFIDFQYGELNESNRAHLSVINILKKEGLYKPLISPFQGDKDKDKDKDSICIKELNTNTNTNTELNTNSIIYSSQKINLSGTEAMLPLSPEKEEQYQKWKQFCKEAQRIILPMQATEIRREMQRKDIELVRLAVTDSISGNYKKLIYPKHNNRNDSKYGVKNFTAEIFKEQAEFLKGVGK